MPLMLRRRVLPDSFKCLLEGNGEEHRLVDVYNMGRNTRRNLVQAALNTEDQDHEEFLRKIKARMDE